MVLSERFELRLDEDTIDAVDAWRTQQRDRPSRSEAIRQLIDRGLSGRGNEIRLSAGERLVTLMLCDVLKALPPKSDREFDPETVKEIVGNGHLWALKSEYSWVFNRTMDDPAVVDEVFEILGMWEQIHESFDALEPPAKETILKEAGLVKAPRYEGFDGNNDDHYGVAFFIIKNMDRFEGFEKALNSHTQSTLPMYRRMLEVYKTIDPAGRLLNADQLVEIFKARIHPSRRGTRSDERVGGI